MEPATEGRRRLVFTRRSLVKGGAAGGIILSAPMIPSFAWATEYEPEIHDEPLDLGTARSVPDPVPHHEPSPAAELTPRTAGGGGHLLLPRQDVTGAHMVAVSWADGPLEGAAIRRHTQWGWSDWTPVHVDPTEHPDDAEAPPDPRRYSTPMWIDDADQLEVVVPAGASDAVLHLIGDGEQRVLVARSATAGASPHILPRSAWNANQFSGTPSVASALKIAIVHHSAGRNDYSSGDVPAIIKSIQVWHQQGRGWNDIAYNFLVDRFGRLWEGRAGGIDKAVVGGHTYGCNTGSVGVCYLGTLINGVNLPSAAENAITSLLSWKFNQVHAVAPTGSTQFAPVGSNGTSKYAAGVVLTHPFVVGHAHFSATQCPGQAGQRLGAIRSNLTRIDTVLGIDSAPSGGYWLTDARGQAHPRNGAPYHGSMAGLHLNQPMIGLAPTASGAGYWMLARDGGIFSFGNARFHGSTGSMRLNRPVVGMATSRTGNGYWLVASDGGIFAYGDARFYGSTGSMRLNAPVVGMARTPSGNGYWLFASDGGIFAFGDAPFLGSAGGSALEAPAVDVGIHPNGTGYWLVLSNGRVLAYNVPNHGRAWADSSDPVVGIAVTPNGGGYWLSRRSGNVSAFGNAT